tara:strand:- start:126 stop:440 length:315 start_codon:yes stop_codon:yes gene_type:complete
MALGLHKHTVQESVNASLGQGGCQFISTAGDSPTPTSGDFIAISMVEDATFDLLTPKDSTIYSGNTGAVGDDITTSITFPAGMTIFGRWTTFSLNSGSVIAYQG